MHLQYKSLLLFALLFFIAPLAINAQKRVLIIFPDDERINIPKRFLTTPEKGLGDSAVLRFLTLKYQFYNVFTQRLNENNYTPIGGLNDKVNAASKYKRSNWFFTDSATQKKYKKKHYLAAAIDQTNKGYYNMYTTADSADYIIFINKISVGGGFFRNVFATKNYTLDVHFDVYNSNMTHLGGRYLRQKVRLTKSMFWSAFVAQFSTIPDDLALYFINMKK